LPHFENDVPSLVARHCRQIKGSPRFGKLTAVPGILDDASAMISDCGINGVFPRTLGCASAPSWSIAIKRQARGAQSANHTSATTAQAEADSDPACAGNRTKISRPSTSVIILDISIRLHRREELDLYQGRAGRSACTAGRRIDWTVNGATQCSD
jgi:hypothetical protein